MSPRIFSSCPKLQGCVSLADVAEGRPVLLRAPLDDKLCALPAGGWGALGSCQPSAKPQFCCCYVVVFFLKSHFLHCRFPDMEDLEKEG